MKEKKLNINLFIKLLQKCKSIYMYLNNGHFCMKKFNHILRCVGQCTCKKIVNKQYKYVCKTMVLCGSIKRWTIEITIRHSISLMGNCSS